MRTGFSSRIHPPGVRFESGSAILSAMRPRLLRPDNFTPPTRTPWGGHKILKGYKAGLPVETDSPDAVVGESWEVSVEPSFPSRFHDDDGLLAAAIAVDPEAWLGAEVARRHGGQTPLLVKLLDSGDDLSVQVHPEDGDPALGDDESGKPESWFVLESEPGGGLYLGFREGVQRGDVEQCLRTGGPLNELLNFVSVSPGDFFIIEAGTVHAIGAGVTLVEPQYVAPGKKGITYRYWDWNRRYDEQGRPDPQGQPRALHVERSLEVTRWDAPRGEAFVESCRPEPELLDSNLGDTRVEAGQVLSRRRLTNWTWFTVEQWSGTGELEIPAAGTMWALTCVNGEAEVTASEGEGERTVAIPRGQSAVVPAACGALRIRGREMQVLATRSAG
jgi:mannose-6-phosphate isomerase